MSISPCDLISQFLAGDNSNFLTDPLVGMEIKRKPRVIFFNDAARSSLHGLRSHTTLITKSSVLIERKYNKLQEI